MAVLLEMDFFWGVGQEKAKWHEIKDGHGDGAMLLVSYPSPNWVNMNLCTSRASLRNKNKMYIAEVKRPSHCTILSQFNILPCMPNVKKLSLYLLMRKLCNFHTGGYYIVTR